MFRCVRDRLMALLKELCVLPLNGRDEFNVLKKFLEKEKFTNEYLREVIEICSVISPLSVQLLSKFTLGV